MKERKVHYGHDKWAYCNHFYARSSQHLMTSKLSEVTCGNCKRRLEADGRIITKVEPEIEETQVYVHYFDEDKVACGITESCIAQAGWSDVTCPDCLDAKESHYQTNPEDPRIAALVGGEPVTVDNAWIGAEVICISIGKVVIEMLQRDSISYRTDHGDLFTVPQGWLDKYPSLYWPNGIVQPKPRKTKKSKVNLIPWRDTSGAIRLMESSNVMIDTAIARSIGLEQEIEIEVYDD